MFYYFDVCFFSGQLLLLLLILLLFLYFVLLCCYKPLVFNVQMHRSVDATSDQLKPKLLHFNDMGKKSNNSIKIVNIEILEGPGIK